jgi:hypothetical protein
LRGRNQLPDLSAACLNSVHEFTDHVLGADLALQISQALRRYRTGFRPVAAIGRGADYDQIAFRFTALRRSSRSRGGREKRSRVLAAMEETSAPAPDRPAQAVEHQLGHPIILAGQSALLAL